MYRKKKTKLTIQQKVTFCQLLGDLLTNGFSLQQALHFLQTADSLPADILELVQQNLHSGQSLSKSFSQLNYSADQVLQVALGEMHGGIARTLKGIANQMLLVQKQRQNFVKAVSYPAMLLMFLTLILVGMRTFLLPQLLDSGMIEQDNPSILFIQAAPWLIFAVLLISLLLLVLWNRWGQKQSYLIKYTFLAKLPLIGRLHRDYYSAYFALEWGKLFDQGLELQQIIACLLATEKDSLMKELAISLQHQLVQGQSLALQLKNYPFLTKEFGQIVQQGEVRGNLGKELLTYSQLVWQRFFARLEFLCSWLQPLVFLFVALLIVSIYVAMLLPLSSGMEGIW
ncbi:type II secretion system F family protein [Enterococcus sp. 669A]|uniref:Type II secretion system F family protein n=1 Tax=Candidatus Enterococcus moelleringii TaxID=2815325 RepID=A0ABS3LGN2_9ENTE|nr:competence type IV pilus assembly protein ComGB [Enterococcus sp. 669A]MBO1308193.1 type II secretion system F family protein [Enterococcus sp. 669A]